MNVHAKNLPELTCFLSQMDLEETFRCSLYTSYRENKSILLPKDEYIKTVGKLLEATRGTQESTASVLLT